MVDLAGASQGAENLASAYVDVPTDKKLDPEAIGGFLFEKKPEAPRWRLLILPFRGEGKTHGGVFLPDKVCGGKTGSPPGG